MVEVRHFFSGSRLKSRFTVRNVRDNRTDNKRVYSFFGMSRKESGKVYCFKWTVLTGNGISMPSAFNLLKMRFLSSCCTSNWSVYSET